MGKLSDLKHIYEAYVNEMNIGIMPDGPSIGSGLNPKPPHINAPVVKIPGQAEEEIVSVEEPKEAPEDSNLEMAKSQVFGILKSANELMNRLQTASEVEPWQLAKIVKACDYVCSINNSLQYDEFEKCQKEMQDGMEDINKGMLVVSQIKDMLTGEDMSVNEEVLRTVIFNIECLQSK